MVDIATHPIKKFRLADLDAASYNPRSISDDAKRGLQESISGLGMLEMPVVNVHGGKQVIVSGHQRVRAMLDDGYVFADCMVVDFDPLKERMANVTMNNPAIQGSWDAPKALPNVQSVLADLPKPNHMEFQKLTDEIRKQAEKMGASTPELPPSETLAASKGAPKSKEGEIYKLGAHRLYCGKCEDGIPLLFGKKRAKATITDPPYGVAYDDGVNLPIANDDLAPAEMQAFLDMAMSLVVKYTDGPCYVFMASKEIPTLALAWERAGGLIHRWLVWTKDSFTMGRGDYHHQYEPALFGCRAGVVPPKPNKARTNVLEFPKPKKNDLHATMKPVALIQTIMEDATEPGDLVMEPFCGSGTTLVVAEAIGRVCFATELEPQHCDTIRKRWAELAHGVGADWIKLTAAATKP